MKNEQTKKCQNCRNDFLLDAEERAFYEKMEMPSPTFCPQCKFQRLMAWRNERSLYRRKNNFSGGEMISNISPEKPFTVYDQKSWWSDKWDPMNYGRDYDFSKPFFQQFRELLEAVPLAALYNENMVNSEYCNHSGDAKNCYLVFGGIWMENMLYSRGVFKSKDSMDVLFVDQAELNYETIDCQKCFNVSFSKNARSCTDSAFLLDCTNCSNCFGCVNLRNKQYHIFNKPYSKKEYLQKLKEYNFASYKNLEKIKKEFEEFRLTFPHRHAHIFSSPNSTGEGIFNCNDCKWCFGTAQGAEHCRYIMNGGYGLKDAYYGVGCGVGELMYEVIDTGIKTSRVAFSVFSRGGMNMRYIFDCHNSNNIFGCIGLRKKEYCILNKQYSKTEYEKMIGRIIKHMNDMPYKDKGGRIYPYGEFFPIELSPFAYNESIAQEYFPLSQEEAKQKSFPWRPEEKQTHAVTLQTQGIPDSIGEVDDSILKETIQCAHASFLPNPASGRRESAFGCNEQCTKAFRIIPAELTFYKEHGIALPRLCPNCRHYARLKKRNPIKLWKRACQCAGRQSENGVYKNTGTHHHGNECCKNEFETTYAPQGKETVYCSPCYQKEVI